MCCQHHWAVARQGCGALSTEVGQDKAGQDGTYHPNITKSHYIEMPLCIMMHHDVFILYLKPYSCFV